MEKLLACILPYQAVLQHLLTHTVNIFWSKLWLECSLFDIGIAAPLSKTLWFLLSKHVYVSLSSSESSVISNWLHLPHLSDNVIQQWKGWWGRWSVLVFASFRRIYWENCCRFSSIFKTVNIVCSAPFWDRSSFSTCVQHGGKMCETPLLKMSLEELEFVDKCENRQLLECCRWRFAQSPHLNPISGCGRNVTEEFGSAAQTAQQTFWEVPQKENHFCKSWSVDRFVRQLLIFLIKVKFALQI